MNLAIKDYGKAYIYIKYITSIGQIVSIFTVDQEALLTILYVVERKHATVHTPFISINQNAKETQNIPFQEWCKRFSQLDPDEQYTVARSHLRT